MMKWNMRYGHEEPTHMGFDSAVSKPRVIQLLYRFRCRAMKRGRARSGRVTLHVRESATRLLAIRSRD